MADSNVYDKLAVMKHAKEFIDFDSLESISNDLWVRPTISYKLECEKDGTSKSALIQLAKMTSTPNE